MVRRPTPPHLAQLELRPATADATDEFFAATMRGFHSDYNAENWTAGRGVFEPARNFGYAVDGKWISTCGAYSRVMTVPGGAVPAAAVTFVTVQPSYRRRGLLTQMMQHQLADIVERGTEPVALLWASESSIYGRFGYGPATSSYRISGPTLVDGLSTGGRSRRRVGRRAGAGRGAADHRRPAPQPACRERIGALDRSEAWWTVRWHDPEAWRDGASAYRFALHYAASGKPDGYAVFRVKDDGPHAGAEVRVVEVDAGSPQGYAALWRFLLSLDLVRSFTAAWLRSTTRCAIWSPIRP